MNEAFGELMTAVEAGDARGPDIAYAKVLAAFHLLRHGRETEAPPLVEEGLAELRTAGNEPYLGDGLRVAAIVYQFTSTGGPHAELQEEALQISRRVGEPYRLANDLVFRAQSSVLAADVDAAERYVDEAAALIESKRHDDLGVTTLRADVALAKRDWATAAAGYARSAASALRDDDVGQCLLDLTGHVAALSALGRYAAVVELDTLRQELRAETGEPDEEMPGIDYERLVAAARAALSAAEADAAAARMRAVPRSARADRIAELGA